MAKKSHPGDGTRNQGVKGGALYGAHHQTAVTISSEPSLFQSLPKLRALLRAN
jgi:hypothetical protein